MDIKLYADGSFIKTYAAIGIFIPDEYVCIHKCITIDNLRKYEPEIKTINSFNVELYAVIYALEEIKRRYKKKSKITIISDCKGVVDFITNVINGVNCKCKRKFRRISSLIEKMMLKYTITLKHVYSHQKSNNIDAINNNIADKLAKMFKNKC